MAGPRVLLIDNYDSFTYNLAQQLGELGAAVEVVRNDATTAPEVAAWGADAVVISPGPGGPADAGISNDVIRELGGRTPLLGVCLGHQCIAEVHGGSVVRADEPRHGKASDIHHDGQGVFAGLDDPFPATRYHSLVLDPPTCPEELVVSARTADGIIMGLRHRTHPVEGVQFHPESVLTDLGKRLLGNFLERLVPVTGERA